MGILTYLIDAQIDSATKTLDGKTLTRPMLLISDSLNTTYGVDVDIGQKTPLRNVPLAKGNKDLVYADVGSAVTLQRSSSGRFEVMGFSKRLPGTYISLPVTLPKYNYGPQIVYAGTPPPANNGGIIVGTPVPQGVTTRVLTYGELETFGGYGTVPYGAIAEYVNGVFSRIL